MHSQILGTGIEKAFPTFGNGNGNEKLIPKLWERESEARITENGQEQEFPLTPGFWYLFFFKASQKCRELGLWSPVMGEESKSCRAFAQDGDANPIVQNAQIEKFAKCLIAANS